jgi:hypothetical protein
MSLCWQYLIVIRKDICSKFSPFLAEERKRKNVSWGGSGNSNPNQYQKVQSWLLDSSNPQLGFKTSYIN